jgi:hypothetical protein
VQEWGETRGFIEKLLYHRATQLGLALALLAVVVGAVCVCYSNRKPRSKHNFLHSFA